MTKKQHPFNPLGTRQPTASPLQQDLQTALSLHRAGKLEKAEKIYRAILRKSPREFDAVHLLGALLFARGEFEESERLLSQAAAINSKSAAAWFNRGNALHALKRNTEALASYDKAIALKADYSDAYNNRGNLLDELGRKDDALISYSRAVALNPYNAQAFNNRGLLLSNAGRKDEALESYDKAITLDPDYAEAYNNRGETLQSLARQDEALEDFDKAVALKPKYAQALHNRGFTLKEQKRLAEALQSFDRAIAARQDFAEAWNYRGNVLNDLGRVEDALQSFDKALACEASYADAHNNRGIVLMELGQLEDAAESFSRAIAIAPGMPVFYRNLVHVRRLSPEDAYFRALEAMARDDARLPDDQKAELYFALARTLDDMGESARGFGCLLKANALARRGLTYDEEKTLALIERVRASWTPALLQRLGGDGSHSHAPIFILGMPRSGSTLIEQILGGHPKIQAGGEMIALGRAIAAVMGKRFDGDASVLTPDDISSIGSHYLEEAATRVGDAPRFTDKMPSNFLNIGFIHLALPQARIIHTRRDPIDTCVSCFFTQFTGGHAFSWGLGELGRYYRAYDGLMAHWRGLLPTTSILEVDYEAVVEDLEGQARRILDYCGLDWDPASLAFHQSSRQVRTASLAQVRQPIYRRSLQRWRAYESQLEPLIEALGPLAVVR